MRPPVDRARIERFLEALGRDVRVPVRCYLVGGATIVWLGLRPRTLDIDITFDVDPKHHGTFIDAVRRLKEELQVNVEEASPGDFIPLPSGYKERSSWVGTYGSVSVFHFDLVSTSLSKIERGTEVDFDDVLALLKAGHLKIGDLQRALDEIVPRMATESLRGEPGRLKANFEQLRRRLT